MRTRRRKIERTKRTKRIKKRFIKHYGGDQQEDRLNTIFSNLKEFEPKIMSNDPWLAVFDKFLSENEVAELLKIMNDGGGKNFIDSTVLSDNVSVKSQNRTSSTFWCNTAECLNNPVVLEIFKRIQSITGFPRENYEDPQFLRYYQGQEYTVHSDFIEDDLNKPWGPRVLTLFLYLSDVEEGGETEFPRLNITIKPRAGRAVLWSSVLGPSLKDIDIRTEHVAKPVLRGVKYSANIWIHNSKFR